MVHFGSSLAKQRKQPLTMYTTNFTPNTVGAFVKLPWVDPGMWRCFFSRTNVGNYLHTFVLEKENATHQGQPREAKRTHPMEMKQHKNNYKRLVQIITDCVDIWQNKIQKFLRLLLNKHHLGRNT